MSAAGPSGGNEPDAKKTKWDEFQVALANQQQADISKLNIDCFGEAFDYLVFDELVAVGATCKFLQKVAGDICKQNYPFRCIKPTLFSTELKCFPHFIRKFLIGSPRDVAALLSVGSELRRLKQIVIFECEITDEDVESMKDILLKVEGLFYDYNGPDQDLLGMIIDSCPRLRHLAVYDAIPVQKYPNLEKLEIEVDDVNLPWVQILELNPNIRKLRIPAHSFYESVELMKKADIKLDELAIVYGIGGNSDLIPELLNELYQRRYFKRFHIQYHGEFDTAMTSRLSAINQMLVGISFYNVDDGDVKEFPTLENVEELIMINYGDKYDILAASLIKLKRIYALECSLDRILPFIRRTVTLKEIKIIHFNDGIYFDKSKNIIDLNGLNKERQPLANGRNLKVTIYVEDKIYVATKWALKGETECGLVRMMRSDSIDWDRHNAYF